MLTSKERLIELAQNKLIDRPPVICPGGMMNMITKELMDLCKVYLPEAHSDARMMADLAKAVYDNKLFENVGVPFCMTVEAEDFGAEVDMGSDIFEPHVVAYKIRSSADYKLLDKLDMEKGRSKVVLDAIRILAEEVKDAPVIGNLTGPVSTASSVLDPVVYYKELIRNKEAAHEFMEFITDQLIEFANAEVEAGADVISISDPSGTGEILGPKLFDEFVVKYLNKLLDGIKDKDVIKLVHICGKMNNVLDQCDNIHCDIMSFDSMVSLKDASEHIKTKILMGNVSTYTLEFGDKDSVSKITKSCLRNGSKIISPACGIGMKTSLENLKEMLKSVEE